MFFQQFLQFLGFDKIILTMSELVRGKRGWERYFGEIEPRLIIVVTPIMLNLFPISDIS